MDRNYELEQEYNEYLADQWNNDWNDYQYDPEWDDEEDYYVNEDIKNEQ